MSNEEQIDLRELKGCVATIVLGQVQPEFARCRENLRSWCDRNGFHNVEWRTFPAVHVESGRDEAAKHMMNCEYEWLLQIDADAVFAAESLFRILQTAYAEAPDSDAVGAYSNLKQEPYLPTIDTGTGAWEEHYPNSGVLPAIRTGAHFLLTKKSAFQKIGPPPWFRSHLVPNAANALAWVDGFARRNLDGENPLAETDEWQRLVEIARESQDEEERRPPAVGEDSGFCDRLLAAGGRLYVDTDLQTGHVTTKTVDHEDLKEKMSALKDASRRACGVLEPAGILGR